MQQLFCLKSICFIQLPLVRKFAILGDQKPQDFIRNDKNSGVLRTEVRKI